MESWSCISSFDDDYDKDDKLDDDDDDEHNCSEFLKLILNLFLFTTFFKNKRVAEETIYKKYLTTKKTRYVELMIIVDNVVVSEKKFKTIQQTGLSACKQKNISDKPPALPPDTWNVLKCIEMNLIY